MPINKNSNCAIKQFKIHYPVAQDNNYSTWNSFNNQYWPAEYLIDKNGIVRRTHFGEGEYDQTEMAIRDLLKERGASLSAGLVSMPDQTPSGQISPETYLGNSRMQYYYPNGTIDIGTYTNLRVSKNAPVNSFSLGGSWAIGQDNSETGLDASLEYNFTADKVYLVMSPPKGDTGTVRVFIDGQLVDDSNAGADVVDGVVTVDSDRLYSLVDLHGKLGNHILRLEFSMGIEVFAFTFG